MHPAGKSSDALQLCQRLSGGMSPELPGASLCNTALLFPGAAARPSLAHSLPLELRTLDLPSGLVIGSW